MTTEDQFIQNQFNTTTILYLSKTRIFIKSIPRSRVLNLPATRKVPLKQSNIDKLDDSLLSMSAQVSSFVETRMFYWNCQSANNNPVQKEQNDNPNMKHFLYNQKKSIISTKIWSNRTPYL